MLPVGPGMCPIRLQMVARFGIPLLEESCPHAVQQMEDPLPFETDHSIALVGIDTQARAPVD
eukprot:911856-Heterocapsa_arctica.AAC.1